MYWVPALPWELYVAPAICGIGCAIAAQCALLDRDPARLVAVGYLTAYWALANAAWFKDMLWLLPVFDLGLGVVAVTIARLTGKRWAETVAELAGVRLVLHVLDGATGHVFQVPYIHALNATFVWMLVVVASSGGSHGCRDLLHRIRHLGRDLSAAPARGVNHGP